MLSPRLAALRSQSRLPIIPDDGWTERSEGTLATPGYSAWRHRTRLWLTPGRAHNQPLAPLTHLSAPLGERIWRGEKEREKQAGCEGAHDTHLCKQCHLTPHQAPLPSVPSRACFPWHRHPEGGIRLKGPNCHLLSMLPGQGPPAL